MENLSKQILQVIPENWLDNFERTSHRFKNVEGYLRKNKKTTTIEVHIIGGKYKSSSIDLNDVEHVFRCNFANCDAQIRIYGELESINIGSEVCKFSRDVELLKTHLCIFGCLQRQTLTYMEIIRKYLVEDGNRRLNTYTGFYVYQKGQGSQHMMNAPFGILGHLFEPDLEKTTYSFCNNNRKMICSAKSKSSRVKSVKCTTIAYVRQRGTHTCKVVSDQGENSVRENLKKMFKICIDDDIPKLREPCVSPFYMFQLQQHALSNGLKEIIPCLEYFVVQCGWMSGFNRHNFVDHQEEEIQNAIAASMLDDSESEPMLDDSESEHEHEHEHENENNPEPIKDCLSDEIERAIRAYDDDSTDDDL